jgi:hypothetical protein
MDEGVTEDGDQIEEKMDEGDKEEEVRENTEKHDGFNETGVGNEGEEVEKDVVKDCDDGMGESKNDAGMDTEREYVVVSFHHLPECLFEADKEKGKWIGLPNLDINETTQKIKEMLKSKEPKNILVLAYQKFVPTTNVATIEKHMNEVHKMSMDSIHQLAIGCIFYIPQFEQIWDRKTELNLHIRLLNLNAGLPPCNLHKVFLVSHNRGKVHYVRPNLFAEYIKETGVGETLSYAGYARIKETGLKYLYNAFEDQERPASKPVAGEVEPPPLFLTPGYKSNAVMQRLIKESGLRQPSKPRGALAVTAAASAPAAAAPAPAVQAAPSAVPAATSSNRGRNRNRYQGKPSYKPRVKIQSNEHLWTKEDDMSPEEFREFRRKKIERRTRGPDANELAERLKTLRIKGVQDGKRTKQKESNLNRRIRELETECNETDKQLRAQRQKNRESRDTDKTIRNLRYDVKEKDRKIRGLKKELDEAEKAMNDYRDAYERLWDGVDNKRKRK